MDHETLQSEAQECRHWALAYVGRPEAAFLLRVAREFDSLAARQWSGEQDEPGGPDAA